MIITYIYKADFSKYNISLLLICRLQTLGFQVENVYEPIKKK